MTLDIFRTIGFIHGCLDEIEEWFTLNLETNSDNVFSYYVLLGRLAAYNELLEELQDQLKTQ